ncbi:MAG: hypothetical protein UZ16_OP3001000220 [Candidatus Hinthialibacteria bacterium OLB16]|nr:MAG: hypothetical protein UZ16_OP3001000220 [Candidatus Hinthialibacteria bacterium OLB16]
MFGLKGGPPHLPGIESAPTLLDGIQDQLPQSFPLPFTFADQNKMFSFAVAADNFLNLHFEVDPHQIGTGDRKVDLFGWIQGVEGELGGDFDPRERIELGEQVFVGQAIALRSDFEKRIFLGGLPLFFKEGPLVKHLFHKGKDAVAFFFEGSWKIPEDPCFRWQILRQAMQAGTFTPGGDHLPEFIGNTEDHALEYLPGALSQNIESPDGFDFIPEELDPDRFR